MCNASAGTLYWSCPQLEEGSFANHFNMTVNSDFSDTVINSSRVFPAVWTKIGSGIGTTTAIRVETNRNLNKMPDAVSGNAMRITSGANRTGKYIGYEIRARGSAGDVFLAGGWCRARSIDGGPANYEPSIIVRFLNITNSVWSAWSYVKFSTHRSGWNYVCGTVAAPVAYARVQIAMCYNKNDNDAYFSHISLSRDLYGSAFTYDANGNVLAVKDITDKQSAATYDSYNNLLSYI